MNPHPQESRPALPDAGSPIGPLGPVGPTIAGVTAPPPAIVNAPPSGLALLKALKRRWQLAIILAPLAAISVAAAVWFFMPPGKHTAKAMLELNPTPPNPVLKSGGEPDGAALNNFRQTQIALIKSQNVLGAALRDPKIATMQTIREVGDPLPWLEQSLAFSAPGDAQVLEVRLQGFYAEDLRVLLNAIIKNYLKEFVNRDEIIRNARRDALHKLFNSLDAENKRTIAAREQFFKQGGANPNQAQLQMAWLQSDLGRLKGEIGKLQTEITELEGRGKMLGNRDPSRVPMEDEFFQEFFAQDAGLLNLREELRDASASVIDAIAKEFAPSIVRAKQEKQRFLEQQIRQREQELRPQAEKYWQQRAANEYLRQGASVNENLELKRTLLASHQKELDRLQRMAEDLARNQVRFDDAAFNNEGLKEMLRTVDAEKRKLEAESNAQPRVREIEEARVIPVDPKERKLKMAIMGAGGIFFLVLAGLSLWEFHGRRVENTDQIVYGLGLPLVGTVPAMPKQRLLGLAGGLNEEEVQQWRFALQEAVATARTMLLNASRSSNMRMVMITSAMAGEGKTSLSTQLAVSLAMAGHRTLLLDFDMRNPSAHKLLGVTHSPGWGEILRGEINVVDAIRTTTLDKLFFIPAGDCDPIALKSLVQEELGQVLNWLRSQYDFVIVDTCPVLPVVDALLLGRHMDGVIFSVLNEVSQIPKIYVATQRVAQLGIRTLGAVVNGVREDKYGYGSYGYGKRGTTKKYANSTTPTGLQSPRPIDPNPVPQPAAPKEGPKAE